MERIHLDADNFVIIEPRFGSMGSYDGLLDKLLMECDPIRYKILSRLTKRYTAHFASPGDRYYFSRIEVVSDYVWPKVIVEIKQSINTILASEFANSQRLLNSCLMQYYPDETAVIGWHSDSETIYEVDSPVASFSMGATRIFEIQSMSSGKIVKFELRDGTLLIMAGKNFQQVYQHRLKPGKRNSGRRMSLTFRVHNHSLQHPLRGRKPPTRGNIPLI